MRLDDRGLIDRSRPMRFTFDGRQFHGFKGDTLASALLAADVRLLGRSFKYHRPRGVWGAGSEEPNALVTVGAGPRRTPNVQATMQELWNGLPAVSQSRWPSLRHDLLAVNDLMAPFFGAGFYYKTFMWPPAAWERVYEPLIRRAAGLGALPTQADPGVSEKAFAFCDLLVIGAGPAGLAAALAAGRAGLDVIVAEERDRLGGRLLLEREEIGGAPAYDWVREVVAELASMPHVRLMPRTTVTGAYDQGTYGALERVGSHVAPACNLPANCFWRIVAKRAVLSTGAIERHIAFPGNDRPGVMSASAVRAYVNRWGVAPGRRFAVFGCNDDVYRTAEDLLDAGLEMTAVVDSRLDVPSHKTLEVQRGVVCGTRGRRGLTRVLVRSNGGERWFDADCLAVAGGWNPAVHLTCHTGGRPVWSDGSAAFVPGAQRPEGMLPAGSARGIFDTAGCLADGLRAVKEAVGAPPFDLPEARGADGWSIAPLWQVKGRGRAFLDMQNDVTAKDVETSVAEGMTASEHLKRWTTQGMATDQGRSSNVTALGVLGDATGRAVAGAGTTTFRPPFSPVPISAMGAGARGEGFAPVRRIPSEDAARARGAPLVEAGLWRRPGYFPAPGETSWRQSCNREVAWVRNAVGVTDVSTLGKIEVGGPDAGAFLDFVYAGRMSSLAEGHVRYGIMLREDGHAMDDGTCARLGADRWLVTTTTAAAGQVMRHLQFAHQCLRPGMALRMTSVTDHWAQFAVAGPKALDLLRLVLDNVPGIPFMGCCAVRVGGVQARLFRISFSGELGFELAVPARWGGSLWRTLVANAEGMGGGAYGLEALEVMRVEKGFLTHREMDGRTTAFDLGFKVRNGSIGAAAAKRVGLTGAVRHQLVGLVSDLQLHAGAFLFPTCAPFEAEMIEGRVTAGCWSPTIGRWIGLGLVRNGRARHGEVLQMEDRMRRVRAECIVGPPCAYDPGGIRMREAR